jgi:membrane associated rhomboid family serine protease
MTKPLWLRIKLMAILLGLMIIVHVVNILMNEGLNQFGIQPRSITQWFHIFTAPFIHGDITHLINNLIGLSIFGGFCLIRSAKFFLYASLFIIAVSGLLVWLFARPGSHVGASGWIFGLWSLSIAMAWFDRRFLNIVLAVVVLFFYGSMIYGVLPSDSRVSFEAHFFGAVAGCMWAFVAIRFNSILFIQDKG